MSRQLKNSTDIIEVDIDSLHPHSLYETYFDYFINPFDKNVKLSFDREAANILLNTYPIVVFSKRASNKKIIISGIRTFHYFKTLENYNAKLKCLELKPKPAEQDIKKYIFLDIYGYYYINSKFLNIKKQLQTTLIETLQNNDIEIIKKLFSSKGKIYNLMKVIFNMNKDTFYKNFFYEKELIAKLTIPRGCFITKMEHDIIFEVYRLKKFRKKVFLINILNSDNEKIIESKKISFEYIKEQILSSNRKTVLLDFKTFKHNITLKFRKYKLIYYEKEFILAYKDRNQEQYASFSYSPSSKSNLPVMKKLKLNEIKEKVKNKNFKDSKVLIFERK